MESELIGEFKGQNTLYRVLPDGVMEVTGQATGKILGIAAFLASTSIGVMENGMFSREVNTAITTMEGDTLLMRAIAIGYPWGDGGGLTRAASVQTTSVGKLSQLNQAMLLHEY